MDPVTIAFYKLTPAEPSSGQQQSLGQIFRVLYPGFAVPQIILLDLQTQSGYESLFLCINLAFQIGLDPQRRLKFTFVSLYVAQLLHYAFTITVKTFSGFGGFQDCL